MKQIFMNINNNKNSILFLYTLVMQNIKLNGCVFVWSEWMNVQNVISIFMEVDQHISSENFIATN